MRPAGLPLTYDECRARFRRAATEADLVVRPHPIAARGPAGQELTIDSVWLGPPRPTRTLTVLSGVHGVEAFLCSTLQTDLLGRLRAAELPGDMGVLVVHVVNPWGMSWGRRQNESNVDLNRNWRRDDHDPPRNEAYHELHPIACPDPPSLPTTDDLLERAAELVAKRGLPWVRDAITRGQFDHPDGLHYGGSRTEESTRVVEAIATAHLVGVERSLAVDLHTGHGPYGTVTFLSDQPVGAAQDQFLRTHFGSGVVEATVDNPIATTGVKSGQIAKGIGQLLGGATHFASSVEFGTASEEEQLAASYLESWVHRHGDLADPDHAAAAWRYRCAFTPDDPTWETTAFAAGRTLLERALGAVAAW